MYSGQLGATAGFEGALPVWEGQPTDSVEGTALEYNDSRAIIAAAQAAAAAGKPSSGKKTTPNPNKGTGRTRPTNNQLLYKAYFRWEHYLYKTHPGPALPLETEACASVTSAFLQVLSTLYNAEMRRVDKPRNVLQILSTNTRRTKVVELSSGTHRVADELRRHCLNDTDSGQYSTNLDRNRYGNDDQYLATVIRYDLEFLDLCPCLVDVEIIDAKAGNESTLVSSGAELCTCTGGRQGILQSHANVGQTFPVPAPAARQGSPVLAPMGPLGGTTHGTPHTTPLPVNVIAGVDSRAPWVVQPTASTGERGGSQRLYQPVPTHSKGGLSHASGGSDLFDALLMAATGAGEGHAGEPPVTSKLLGSQGIPRQRSRLWQAPPSQGGGEVDSLQNALEAWKQGDDEIASGQPTLDSPFRRVPSKKRLPRKGSYSNVQTLDEGTPGGPGGTPVDPLVKAERSGENGPQDSVHSGEGDTEAAKPGGTATTPLQDDAAEVRGILRNVHRQSSAVNLAAMSRLGKDAELRRLADELAATRETNKALEGSIEELRTREAQHVRRLEVLQSELNRAHLKCQRLQDQNYQLRQEVEGLKAGHAPESRAQDEGGGTVGQTADSLAEELQMVRATVQRLEMENQQLRLSTTFPTLLPQTSSPSRAPITELPPVRPLLPAGVPVLPPMGGLDLASSLAQMTAMGFQGADAYNKLTASDVLAATAQALGIAPLSGSAANMVGVPDILTDNAGAPAPAGPGAGAAKRKGGPDVDDDDERAEKRFADEDGVLANGILAGPPLEAGPHSPKGRNMRSMSPREIKQLQAAAIAVQPAPDDDQEAAGVADA